MSKKEKIKHEKTQTNKINEVSQARGSKVGSLFTETTIPNVGRSVITASVNHRAFCLLVIQVSCFNTGFNRGY